MAEVALGDPEFKKLKSAQILCIHWKASHLALPWGPRLLRDLPGGVDQGSLDGNSEKDPAFELGVHGPAPTHCDALLWIFQYRAKDPCC